MTHLNRLLIAAAAIVLAACTTPNATMPGDDAAASGSMQPVAADTQKAQRPRPAQQAQSPEGETVAVTFGRGIAKADALDVTFMFNVTVYAGDAVEGTFSHSATGPAGSLDLAGEVTCATLDSASGRGWLGGKITRNDSTDPRFAAAVGHDVWFRVLDRNRDQMQPLIGLPETRSGRIRSAQGFCDSGTWKDDGLYLVEPGALAIFP